MVDLDDTLTNHIEVWVDSLNKKHGTNVKAEDITEWSMKRFFPNLSVAELYEPHKEPDFWKRVKPLPMSQEYMQKLHDDGHEIIIVTASHPNYIGNKLDDSLFRHFPFITSDDVIVTTQKQLIKGDVLIDDAPHNLIGGDYFKVLMDAPHNRSFDTDSIDAIRVKNWEQIYKLICVYARKEF